MANLIVRTGLQLFKKQIRPLTLIDVRCCYQKPNALSTLNKKEEIKGYFVEDFNVKGQFLWAIQSRFLSASLIYMTSSIAMAAASYYTVHSEFAVDIIYALKVMEILEYFDVSDTWNPRVIVGLGLYFITEAPRILIAFRFCKSLRDLLYKYKFIPEPKYRPFKDEPSYDETKINKF
uniref:Uncharacterized protein n=1 Tax=Tetranychus urticae TaxID=32264 RepID=T1KHG8_TETUR